VPQRENVEASEADIELDPAQEDRTCANSLRDDSKTLENASASDFEKWLALGMTELGSTGIIRF
jgi:hypothetical protein